MRNGIGTFIAVCLLGLASQTLGTTQPGDGGQRYEVDSCRSHLHALVAYLEETAQLEGKTLIVEWRKDGSVRLSCEDFLQRMWCRDGELHVDFSEPAPEGPVH